MASTAATVFFCRPGRISLKAVLTGFFDCAHIVCAIADAATNSKAGITKVLFILSSFQFGFQLAFSKRMLCHCYVIPGYIAFGKNQIATECFVSNLEGQRILGRAIPRLRNRSAYHKSCNDVVIAPLE